MKIINHHVDLVKNTVEIFQATEIKNKIIIITIFNYQNIRNFTQISIWMIRLILLSYESDFIPSFKFLFFRFLWSFITHLKQSSQFDVTCKYLTFRKAVRAVPKHLAIKDRRDALIVKWKQFKFYELLMSANLSYLEKHICEIQVRKAKRTDIPQPIMTVRLSLITKNSESACEKI